MAKLEVRFFTGNIITTKVFDGTSFGLGRDINNDIVIDRAGVSRKHLNISIQEKEIIISELSSKYGTFIDGIKIAKDKEHRYKVGEQISFGRNNEFITMKFQNEISKKSEVTLDNLKQIHVQKGEEIQLLCTGTGPVPVSIPAKNAETNNHKAKTHYLSEKDSHKIIPLNFAYEKEKNQIKLQALREKSKIIELESLQETLNQELQTLKEDISQKKEDLKTNQKKSEKLKLIISSQNDKISDRDNKINKFKKEQSVFIEQIDNLKMHIKLKENQLDSINSEINHLNSTKEELSSQCAILDQELEEIILHSNEITSLIKEKEVMLQKTIDEEITHMKEIVNSKKELATIEKKKKVESRNIHVLHQDNTKIKKENSKLEFARGKIIRKIFKLKAKQDFSQSIFNEYQKKVKDIESKIFKREHDLSKKNLSIIDKQNQITQLQHNKDQAQLAYSTTIEALNEIKKDIDTNEISIKNKTAQLAKINQKVEEKILTIKEQEKSIKENEVKIQLLNQEVVFLEKDLNDKKSSKISTLRSIDKEIELKSTNIDKLKSRRSHFQQDIEKLLIERKELKIKIPFLQKEEAKFLTQKNLAENKRDKVEKELRETVYSYDQATSNLNKIKKEINTNTKKAKEDIEQMYSDAKIESQNFLNQANIKAQSIKNSAHRECDILIANSNQVITQKNDEIKQKELNVKNMEIQLIKMQKKALRTHISFISAYSVITIVLIFTINFITK